jgi:hypothetical protein
MKTSKYNCRTNTGHIFTLKHVPGRYNPTLSREKKNTKIEQELGAEIMTSHLLLCET